MATVKKVQKNGDIRIWRFRVKNSSNIDCFGTELSFDIPEGVSLTGPSISGTTGISVPVGVYNPSEKKWYIGKLLSGQATDYVDWEFTVDDIEQADEIDSSFLITAIVSSRCSDSDSTNNDLDLMIQVSEECLEINLSVGGELPVETSEEITISV